MKDHSVLVVRNNKGEILFARRSLTKKALPGMWALASGTVEVGESIMQTAEREVTEELGLVIRPTEVLFELELEKAGVRLHFVLLESGDMQIEEFDTGEIAEVMWMTTCDFYDKHIDEDIVHGLRYLRDKQHLVN